MNRFKAALTLNQNDELVWYKFRKDLNATVKCLWRKGDDTITFVQTQMKSGVDSKGYATFEEDKVLTAFTMYVFDT